MDDMKLTTIVAFTGFLIAGCSNQPQSQPPVEDKTPASSPDYHLKYKSWDGVSPGAGFMYTSLQFVELDLSKGRIRRIGKSASPPDPMLPNDDASIAKLVAQVPWIELTPGQADAYRKSIDAWLKTGPPPRYNNPMALGREDGQATSITVTWGRNTVTTSLNPRGGYRKGDPLLPPEEWKAMLDLLVMPLKVPNSPLK